MNATASRGRRILAVLATSSALLLPATTAQAAPSEQANDRAHEAQSTDQRPADEDRGARDGDEVTEDDDAVDNDGETRPNTPDVNGDEDNQHPSGKDRSEEPGGSGNQGRAQHDPDDDGNGPDRSNGGLDQPGGQGGEDLDDQDGNNGCGNDDDFEDDNEGLCGGNRDRGRPDAREDVEKDTKKDTKKKNTTEDTTRDAVEEESEEADRRTRQERTQGVEDADAQTTTAAPESGVAGVIVEREERELAIVEVPAAVTVTEDVQAAVLGVTFTSQPAQMAAATFGAIAPAEQEQAVLGAQESLPRTGAGLAGLAAVALTSLAGGTALSRRRG